VIKRKIINIALEKKTGHVPSCKDKEDSRFFPSKQCEQGDNGRAGIAAQ
jgi:hypothetical protein